MQLSKSCLLGNVSQSVHSEFLAGSRKLDARGWEAKGPKRIGMCEKDRKASAEGRHSYESQVGAKARHGSSRDRKSAMDDQKKSARSVK